MKVTLVTNSSPLGRHLAAVMYAAEAVDRIVIERPRTRPGVAWRMLRRHGPFGTAVRWALNRHFHGVATALVGLPPLPPHQVTSDINDLAVASDELVMCFGTSYVKRRTLARSRVGFLNLHTGILPAYRGVKSEFWALYHRDPQRLGWTLHFMTPQLDEGAIVRRQRVPWGGESPAEIRVTIVRDAAPVLAQVGLRARGGDVPQGEPQGAGTYYSAPGLSEWVTLARRRRRPDGPDATTRPTRAS